MKNSQRILIAGYGSRGDIQPLLVLALALQARGHQVTLSAPPNFSDWIQAHGLAAHATGRDIRALIESVGAELTKNPIKTIQLLKEYIFEDISAEYASIMPLAANFDLVIGGALQFAAFSAAEYYQIPYVYVVYSPQLLPSRDHMSMLWPWPNLPAWFRPWAWQVELKAWNWRFRPLINQLRKTYGLPAVGEVMYPILSPYPLLAVYPEIAPPPSDYPVSVACIGHLNYASSAQIAPQLEDFLVSGTAPIYFGFGSMNGGNADKVTAAIIQMAKQSKERFILAKGWAGLGQGNLPENIFLADETPHEILFPRLKAVIHHGGAGTTATAARAGVPQLMIPHLLDQHYWGHQIQKLGLGPAPVPIHSLRASVLATRVRQLNRQDYALRAMGLGRKLARYNASEAGCDFLEQTVLKSRMI